jgi:glutaredoxin 3
MPPITIYTTSICPYCAMAKRLLTKKGAAFREIDVGRKPELRAEMEEKSGRYTVPQIWIGDTHVGGCDDLHALDAAGKLDPMLAG